MENFISEHLLGKNVDVYCGDDDKFKGTLVGCSDGVLTLETKKGLYTYVAVSKVIAIWTGYEGDERKRARKKSNKR